MAEDKTALMPSSGAIIQHFLQNRQNFQGAWGKRDIQLCISRILTDTPVCWKWSHQEAFISSIAIHTYGEQYGGSKIGSVREGRDHKPNPSLG